MTEQDPRSISQPASAVAITETNGRVAPLPAWMPRAWSWLRVLGGPIAALVTILIMTSGVVPSYHAFTIALAAVYGLLVLSLSLLAHWNGVWSIGHPALLAIGAYLAAWGSNHGWGLGITIVIAMVVCAIFGAFLGFAGARFSVLYVALLTMAFTLVIMEIIQVWQDVTNGDQGVPVTVLKSVFGDVYPASNSALAIVVAVFGVALALSELVRRTSFRMRMVAAKTHPLAAKTLGIAPEAQAALAFAGSGATAGLAGVMLTLVSGFVSPESFSLVLAINLIAATVLGGPGSLIGAIVGGAFLASAPTLAGTLHVDQPYLMGGLLILALIFLPEGVVPSLAKLIDRWTRWSERLQATTIEDHKRRTASLKEVAGPSDADRTDDTSDRTALLDVEDLGVAYGGLRATQDVDLRLAPGEILGIIGPNGAGKTTLLNAISGLTLGGKVTGSAHFRGENLLRTKTTARRRLGIGRTFQHAELFGELTVLENVLCVNRRIHLDERDRAFRLLTSVDLTDVAHRKPTELPFGLQKRVDLARAIAEHPRLLILDEPFGGLDTDERQTLTHHITRLRDLGTSIMIIDHVLEDLFAVADRVVALDFGKLVAAGTPEEILEDEDVRSSYLGVIEGEEVQPPSALAGESQIRISGVEHHFGGVQALRGIDVDVPAGISLGIVGANGGGKSTLGRILHGSLKPSSGARKVATVDGRPLKVGLVPEGRALFKTLSVRENLEVAAYAAGMSLTDMRRRIDELADWLPERVRTRMDVSAGSLSGGEQQLVAIARALVSEPDVLVLDEPALGLSPAMVKEVYRQVADLEKRGITTVLLDQSLGRALQACGEVLVLRQGRIVAHGNNADPSFAARAETAYFGEDPEHVPDVEV